LVEDIVQQDEVKRIVKNAIECNTITHMLFYGPPGTGKTTTALATVKEMFCRTKDNILNQKIFQERVLELNASDERGIKVVREKIKIFASSSLNNHYTDVPPFKVIILDEADALTNDSQYALRRIIEKYTTITRFILICNYVTKIITPLSSRCVKLRFQNVSTESLRKIVSRIKDIVIDDTTLNFVYTICNGDLRRGINLLQRACYVNKTVTKDIIEEISGYIPDDYVDKIWSQLSSTICYPNILKVAKQFCDDGYSSLCLIKRMCDKIIGSGDVSETNKSKLLIALSDIDHYINDNANEYIQIVKLFSLVASCRDP
jgi:replication factor C subunit 2/4